MSPHRVQLLGGLLVLGVSVHLLLVLLTAAWSEKLEPRRSRLRPRHEVETEVRGKTYHVHKKGSVDRKSREFYQRRRQTLEVMRPHLVARREIFAQDYEEPSPTIPLFYKLAGGELTNLRLKCGSCAIIGSAGTLTTSHNQNRIDQSDCVFRLGLSPVFGYEEDVGSKTTVRIVDGKSFSELLKRPEKMVTGSLSSQIWVVFHFDDVDDMFKLTFKLPLIKKLNPNLKIYIVTRRAEREALVDLRTEGGKLGYQMREAVPSTLWYSMQAVLQTGCPNAEIFGVPDPKFCKNSHGDSLSRSRYWGKGSPPFCGLGKDSGTGPSTAESQLLSLTDRRAMVALAKTHPKVELKFYAPVWPQVKKNRTT